ncbi:MAG TPA: hypothetical protein VN849_01900 [Stellaceae bacterium]|nr:hypothetical protein [Stellaceae bacterium]
MTSTPRDRCQLRISGLTKPNCAVEVASEPGDRAGDHHGGKLVAEGRVAERAHALLVVADADKHLAEQRAQDRAQQRVDQRH